MRDTGSFLAGCPLEGRPGLGVTTLTTESQRADAWRNLYSFTLEPQTRADYEMAHHYMATHPSSPFVSQLVVQRPTPQARYALRNRVLTVDDGTRIETRMLRDEAALREVLERTFGVTLPADVRLDAAVPD